MLRKTVGLLTLLMLIQPAFAGSATVNYSSSGSSPFRTTTDGSSNNLSNVTIWDSSAGANGLAINSSGQAAIQAPPSLPLPTGAATSALQTTINTTLGSPFQAGGSIGNTGFNALQGGVANATGNPFYFVFGTGATLPAFASTPTVNLGTIGSAATAANQTNVQTAPGTSASTAITIQGNASGIAVPVSISGTTPISGTVTANQGTANATPWNQNVAQWDATALGAPTAWGSAPTGNVIGVNANVLNSTLAVTQSGAWSLNNISGTISLPTGASTAANQTNVQGAVGAPSATAITVQGNASGTPIPITGTFSTSGFQPASSSATLSVSSTSARVALPTNTGTVIIYNTGNQVVSTTLGNSSVTVTATSGDQIEPGCWIGYNPSGSQTNIAGITSTGTSSLVITGGTGLPTGGCSSSFAGTIGTVNQGSAGASPWLVTGSGTAGSAANGVLTVQGIASMTPVQISGTVTANLGTLNGAATATNQTNVQGSASGGTAATSSLLAGGVYNSSAPTLTTGQQSSLQLNANGALNVAIVSGGGGGGVSQQDNTTFTYGTTTFAPMGGVYNSSITSLTSGSAGAVALTSDRNIFVNLNKMAGTALGAPSNYGTSPGAVAVQGVNAFVTNTVTVSGTVTANAGSGTFATNTSQWGGTSVVNGGTAGAVGMGGIQASGASISGNNPVLIGGRAENAEATAVSNGQLVARALDLVGRNINFPYANKENLVEGAANTTGTTSTSLISAPGASTYIYVTAISCFNSGSTGTTVSFQNGSGGATIWEGYTAANGGGFTHTFVTPIGGVNYMTANTALYFAAGSATSTLYCNASGFKGS